MKLWECKVIYEQSVIIACEDEPSNEDISAIATKEYEPMIYGIAESGKPSIVGEIKKGSPLLDAFLGGVYPYEALTETEEFKESEFTCFEILKKQ